MISQQLRLVAHCSNTNHFVRTALQEQNRYVCNANTSRLVGRYRDGSRSFELNEQFIFQQIKNLPYSDTER